MPTGDQVKGLIERVATIGVTYLTAKGYIDVKMATEIGPLLITVLSILYALWINRPKAIVQSAAALPNTIVVTSSEMATATPEKNVVSELTNKVVAR